MTAIDIQNRSLEPLDYLRDQDNDIDEMHQMEYQLWHTVRRLVGSVVIDRVGTNRWPINIKQQEINNE